MRKFKITLITTIIMGVSIFSYSKYEELETKKIMQEPYVKGYLAKKEQLLKLKNTHDFKIVMIGDSLTAGNNWNKSLDRKDILNMGQGSDFTYIKLKNLELGIINRLDGLDSLYKKAFLMIGINDFNKKKEPEDVFKTYIKIINYIKDKQIEPIIQSTLYITKNKYNWDYNFLNQKVKTLNDLLETYCKKHNIKFIDLNKNLSENDTLNQQYTYDGVHLNQNGYVKWSSIIKPYMKL